MKYIFLVLPALFSARLMAQAPRLPVTGATPEKFIPQGWTLVANVAADFNKDKLADAAIVIQQGQSKRTAQQTCQESYHPQLLFIVLKQPDGTYKLSASTQKIFGEYDCMQFQSIGQRAGTLKVVFGDMSINGTSSEHDYFFRYQQNGWLLIGYKNEMAKNAGSDMGVWGTDKNLVTGTSEEYRLKIDPKSEVMEGPKEITATRRSKPKPLIKLTDLDVDNVSFMEN